LAVAPKQIQNGAEYSNPDVGLLVFCLLISNSVASKLLNLKFVEIVYFGGSETKDLLI